MPSQATTLSILLALQFVLLAGVLFVLLPFEVVAPLVPLFVLLTGALYLYRR